MKVKNKIRSPIILVLMSILFIGLTYAQSQENWVRTLRGAGYSASYGKAIIEGWDQNDCYLYVAGVVSRTGSYTDFSVVKIRESNGDTVWHYKYTGAGNQNAEANAICWGDSNNSSIYAAGYYYQNGSSLNNIVVVKLDTAGTQTGIYTYDGNPGADNDVATALCYGRGNIFVAGYSDKNTGGTADYEYTVIKIDTLMAQKAVYRFSSTTQTEAANSIVYDGGAYIYSCGSILGYFFVYKMDTTNALTIQAGWPYVYSGAGSGADQAMQVVYGGDGKIYAAGYSVETGFDNDFTVVALNNDGTVYWGPYIYDGRAHGDDRALSVAYQSPTSVYAAGYSTDSTGTGIDYTVINLSNDVPRWVYRYNGPGDSYDVANKIVVSGSYAYATGAIIPVSQNYSDVVVTKHDLTHGATNPYWVYTYDGPGTTTDWDGANDIAISDPARWGTGNLYITGNSYVTGNDCAWMAIDLPENFPPYIPVLINPADGGFLNNFGVTFRWHKSTDPEGNIPITYILKYDTLASFATADSQVVNTDTFKLVTFANSDSYYYWKVKAKDSGGRQSLYSPVRSFSFDLIAPNTPALVSPIDQALVTDTSVTFAWTSVTFKGPPAPVRYIIQVDTVTSFTTPIKLDTVDVTTKLYNLNTDDWYYWHVQAYDLAGNQGSYSGYEAFGVDIVNPLIDSVTILYNTELLGPFDAEAKVTDFFGIDSVVLYYQRMEDHTFYPVKMVPGADPAWYIAQIPAVSQERDTVKYYFWAEDIAGHTSTYPDSGYYWFVANAPGIAEHQETPVSFSFGLRSNPAKGRALFNLALPQDAFITLRLYDVSGRLIDKLISARKSAGYYQIPWAKDVSSGIFFYHLDSPWQQKIGKLVLLK